MNISYIFDTNILIYLLKDDQDCIDLIKKLKGKIGISIISYMEVLMGTENPLESERLLNGFELININKDIAQLTVQHLKKFKSRNLKSTKLSDSIIASTAVTLKAKLVTRNIKDFQNFNKLEIISMK
jgi:predicted nucleic acid-binding protein